MQDTVGMQHDRFCQKTQTASSTQKKF